MAAGAGGTGGMAGGGAGGAGGLPMLPECSMEPGPAMCGANACAAVEPGALCVKTCCTTDGMCGTSNSVSTTCAPTLDAAMCPPEMILTQMTPGCCVPGTNECGIVNLLTGDPPCYRRQDVPLASLAPKNCDGTPVMMTGGMGGMAGGGMGGMAGGGMGGTGGEADPDAGM